MKPKSTVFEFKGYALNIQKKQVTFDYSILFSNQQPLNFTETIVLPRLPKDVDQKTLRSFLEPLHLILGISYYKLYCSPKIVLPFKISKDQAEFWNTIYKKGLGEFLYRNKLDPKVIAKFPYSSVKPAPVLVPVNDRSLLGIGGGKDSIVSAELLKENKHEFSSFLVETQRKDLICEKVIKAIGKPSIKIKRVIDPKLFEKHEGSYNGHIPVSAIFAFLGLLSAGLYKYKFVLVGNEHSSNFGNLEYKGLDINHQWSKTSEFESLLQDYIRKYITPDIVYASALRQFYEIRIAKMFAKYVKYHRLFTSCNRSFKVHKERTHTLWCGECPKCAFTFLMLAPFLSKTELVGIFGKNLLNDKNLIPLYRDLLGIGNLKPFDCVGTFAESRSAFSLVYDKYRKDSVVKELSSKVKNEKKLQQQVLKTVPSLTTPTQFRFLGIESVCILGFGKEGGVTLKYLKKFYPKLKVGILDKAKNKNYLKLLENYDLAVKTPGIHKSNVTIPYVTATNLFFSSIKNLTIGVTGSKGKSTTASLIYEMLKADGRKSRLVGNIGNPMLSSLLTKIDADEIFVIELSSYMLDDIEYSPNIAILLNLFPEHMNYHGGVEEYYKAKEKIFAQQKPGDVALRSKFKVKIPVDDKDIPLLGEHNRRNIKAGILAVRKLGVSDESIAQAIKNFKPLAHRLEVVGEFKGIKFVDDAISTTPESTIEALRSLKNVKTIFLGGEDRGYDFKELECELRALGVENIVLFPDTGKRILASTNGFKILKTKNMESAVKFAYKVTPAGSVCLLSTASPSYSVWKNFEEKGDLFKRFVKKYSK